MSVIDRSKAIYGLCMKLRQVGRMQVGRILGTVQSTKGSYKALIDLIERSYFVRAEINALTALLVKKKLVTEAELSKQMEEEYRHLFTEMAKRWPEITFEEDSFIISNPAAWAERVKKEEWPP